MDSCSKNLTSEEIISLIMWEENKIKKVLRSRERKQMDFHPSQNMSKKSKAKSSYDKGKSKFTSLQETLSAIDEEYELVRNVTALLLESGAKDIPTDEEDNFEDNASFSTEVAGELEVDYNETSEPKDENEIDGPTSSNNDRRRAATRNITKITTTSARTMNWDNEFDPDDKDYVFSS